MEKSIHLRMPKILYKESLEIKEHFGFTSIQEFIKEAVRKTIFEYHKQKALKNLRKNFGSLKGKVKRLSKEESNKLAMGLTPEKGRAIFKKYGLI